jgi:hypothetical protein
MIIHSSTVEPDVAAGSRACDLAVRNPKLWFRLGRSGRDRQ